MSATHDDVRELFARYQRDYEGYTAEEFLDFVCSALHLGQGVETLLDIYRRRVAVHEAALPANDDQGHAHELLRFISTANRAIVEDKLDMWCLIHLADPEHPGHLRLRVRGDKREHHFEFDPPCTCNLADTFSYSVDLMTQALAVANANAKGKQVVRHRGNGRTRH